MSDLTAAICPFCGAPLRELVNGACPFCKTIVSSSGGTGAVPERRPTGTVWLEDCGRNKIGVIKVLRENTGLGLKESKDLADGAVPGRPIAVARGLTPEQAAAFADALRNVGASAGAE